MPPSSVVTVIVAVSKALAVTKPVEETVATLGLLDVQVTDLLVAFDGLTVAVKVDVSPTVRVKDDLLSETPVTLIVVVFTVIWQAEVLLPSMVVTVMVAVPAAFAVIKPLDDTVATLVLFEDQVTALFVALEGETVAVSVSDAPTFRVNDDLFKETLVTGTVTFTAHVAVLFSSAVLTVMIAVPAALAVITPDEDTVATLVLLDVHVTDLFVALDGDTVAVSVSVSPTARLRDVLLRETQVTLTVGVFTNT